ncbi:MAG: hypothetical protein PHI59_03045 [Candidatus Omnitrophica bacterium]|nr:hypothetical protein [Candidatus Omnitrophota bacterium]
MKIEYKSIDELILDPDNARFAELYDGSDKEEDLIEYLLYTEAAEEVAKHITDIKQFYPDAALWVIARGEKFLVKDGNRRCAAVKALQNPKKYTLGLSKMNISNLPVLVYTDENELNRRIQEEHTHSLFKEWDRIAKALKAFEMHNAGSSEEAIMEIDSEPSQLIKLASFYYEAVKISGEDLKKLLRRGKGNTGGKTIIFERLFSYAKICGYKFKGKPSYQIEILDKVKFGEYVNALVEYLKHYPNTTHIEIDREKEKFLSKLKHFGFTPDKSVSRSKTSKSKPPAAKKGSIKNRPIFGRKQIATKIKRLIDECYSLDYIQFTNSKLAISRVTFESILKYVLEETKYKGKKLKDYDHFRSAFYDKNNPRKYTNFTILQKKFIELVKNIGTKKAFESFDLDKLHQIIHNYKTAAVPSDARAVSENLIPLIEFMLQDTNDLLISLDTQKLL